MLHETAKKEKFQRSIDDNESVQKKAAFFQDNRIKTIQKKANNTGLPNQLKSGIENLSGHSMDDVKVHYNSSKPAQLNAHAYAQGTDIHLASGQEKHLPHEAWHVVQQKQGRVRPTKQLKSKVNINDDVGLEKEADVMGTKAMKMTTQSSFPNTTKTTGRTVQRVMLDTHIGPINSTTEHKKLLNYIERTDIDGLYELKRQLVVDLEAQLFHDDALFKRIGRRIEELQAENTSNRVRWIIKLELPGSGDTLWRSNSDKIQGQITRVPGQSIMHERSKSEKPDKTTFTIAGPLGQMTTGAPIGTADTGSNSIERNVETAYIKILNHIRGIRSRYPYDNDCFILVKIKAHSRNAVAGARIAKLLRGTDSKLKIEYVGFDPVPGPGHDGEDIDNDIGSIDESTVIYSMQTEYKKFFTPTRMRHMKRLIISKQLHGGGIRHGYLYNGHVYKGSKINELPRGIYFDKNEQDSIASPLVRIDPNQASEFFKGKLTPGYFDMQADRKKIIKSAVDDRADQDVV